MALVVVLVASLIALAVILPIVVLGSSSFSHRFQSNPSLLPAKTPLDHTALFEPAGKVGSSGSGGAKNFDFAIIDPATGTISPVQPFPNNTLVSTPWVAKGDEVIDVVGLEDTVGFPNVGTAVAITPGQPQLTRTLGRASYVVDGSTPGEIWLVVDPDYPNPTIPDSGCTVEEVLSSGVVLLGPRSFPCGWSIEGSSPNGLLVERGQLRAEDSGLAPVTLSTWNPLSDRVERSYGSASDSLSVDADRAGIALWNECGNPPCTDNATNLASERTRMLPALPSGWNLLTPYALSPDGRFAAVLAISDATRTALENNPLNRESPPCCYFGLHPIPSELLVYNLRLNTLVETRPLMVASNPIISWSPDSGWLFVTQDLQHIEAVPMWSDSKAVQVVPTSKAEASGPNPNDPAESFLPYSR